MFWNPFLMFSFFFSLIEYFPYLCALKWICVEHAFISHVLKYCYSALMWLLSWLSPRSKTFFPQKTDGVTPLSFSVPDDLLKGSRFLGALSSECSTTYKKIMNYFLNAAIHTLYNIYHFSHFRVYISVMLSTTTHHHHLQNFFILQNWNISSAQSCSRSSPPQVIWLWWGNPMTTS